MKTNTPKTSKITLSFTIVATAFLCRIVQSAQVITRYSYWLLSLLIVFSCQRNLTQTDTSVETTPVVANAAPDKFIVIDTFQHSLNIHPSLPSAQPQILEKIQDKTKRFYTLNSMKTKWLEENAPNAIYFELFDQLKNSSCYGLSSTDYDVDAIEQHVNRIYRSSPASVNEIVELDIHLTEVFFLFASHLRDGRISETGDNRNVWIREIKTDNHADIAMLMQTKDPEHLKETISKLQPASEQYTKLQKALAHFRSLEKFETGKSIRSTEKIKPADVHAAIPAIRKKLSLTDRIVYAAGQDSISGQSDSLRYDQVLVMAVKAFQERHGLETDGVIGGKTLQFLNQSFKEKADLIALNMERMRWHPETYGDQYIRVNVPEYKLRIFEKDQQTLEMKVIVGSVKTPSPIFHDSLEHIVFSPTWTVPMSIMKGEVFPRLKKNPAYYSQKDFTLYKNGVEIDPATERWDSAYNAAAYRLVQKPGRDNALGLVKFIMPNDMNVYLHDTPDHSLFSKNYRALSHGCIRLDDPARLAAYLLQGEKGWDAKTINKAMKSNNPTKLPLKKYYQVHLEYNTVWVDEKGQINFREDIYGHDKRHLVQLNTVKKNNTSLAAL